VLTTLSLCPHPHMCSQHPFHVMKVLREFYFPITMDTSIESSVLHMYRSKGLF